MKKLDSTWYNMLIVLTAIAVIAGAALGYANELTSGPIAENKARQLADGIKAVMNTDEVEVQRVDTVGASVVYHTSQGVAVQAKDANAFGGTLTILVGFDAKGTILGYQILETSETPGLGAKADKWFQKDGKGNIIGMNPGQNNMTVKKDGGEVDAITASTITSRAFLRAVNEAYAAMAPQAEDAQSGATTPHHEMNGKEDNDE
ncbi:MAG: RnfABCDGE type electron transport complex subunit G [Bacteroidaceae bacterium]|jgi:electron transport complex protein RnfG|nr:RnfABCDGE type electron transport complex subunit G [Bacteroidaceae bacterium]